nr:hypothetical protein [Nanoarchaeum sp.]
MLKKGLFFAIIVVLLAFTAVDSEAAKTCAQINHPNCIPINDCGFYNYPSGAYLLLSQDISDPMSCIFLGGNVVLDLNGYTIKYQDANYPTIPNNDFEIWNGNIPSNWDISLAPSIVRRSSDYKQLVNGSTAFIPTSGQTIVSDWVYLPVANRHYRGMIIFQAESSGSGPTVSVESQTQGIICTKTAQDDFEGGGEVAFCDFDNQPAGNYRLRVTTSTSSTYFDLAGIVPAHDIGVGSVRAYYDSGCNLADGTGGCIAPDYVGQTSITYPTLTIQNGIIKSNVFSYSSVGIRAADLLGGTVNVYNITVYESGIDSKTSRVTQSGEIAHSYFYNYQPWITTRHSTSLSSISLGSNSFHDNYAEGGQGVITVGGPAKIYNNVIRNDQAVTNHYAIMMSGDGAEIYNNVFNPIRGSGILMYHSQDNLVYNNTFYVNTQICNVEYSQDGGDTTYSTNAIRMNDYGAGDTAGNKIYDNTFHINGNYTINPLHPDCMPITSGIFYTTNAAGNEVYNNKFYVTKKNDLDQLHTYGLYVGGLAIPPADNRLFHDNYFESNDKVAWITSFYGDSANIVLENNSFVKIPNIYYTPDYENSAIQIGSYIYPADNLQLINNKFLNGFDSNLYYFTGDSGIYDLSKQWYLHLYVKDSNNNPINNAQVRAAGVNSEVSGYTNSNGYVKLNLVEYTESGETWNSGSHIRVNNNPYNIYVNSEYKTQVTADSEKTLQIVGSGVVTPVCGNNIT